MSHFYATYVHAELLLSNGDYKFVILVVSVGVLFPVPVPDGTFVYINRFSSLCGWLVQRQRWRVKGWMWPSEQARSARANSWLDYQRPLQKYMGEEMRILSIHPCGTSRVFTCRKILRHGTFPLYFSSERKVCCGFLSNLKIHRLGRVLNPQPLGPVASTVITKPPNQIWRRHKAQITRFNVPEIITNYFVPPVIHCTCTIWQQRKQFGCLGWVSLG
jgi:hypothetical protein